MKYLRYDGSIEAFLTAVFDYFTFTDKDNVCIRKNRVALPPLFVDSIEILYDENKVVRVVKKLKKIIKSRGLNMLLKALYFDSDDVEDTIIKVIEHILQSNKNILGDVGNPYVLELHDILKKVGRERHRMLGFIRFKLANDGVYYAIVSPDFDVISLTLSHFKNRFPDQKWLIFDEKRNYGFYYDLHKIERVEMVQHRNDSIISNNDIQLDEKDEIIQSLWKNYFTNASIESRKNHKLHLQYMPRRYWKYLIEKEE